MSIENRNYQLTERGEKAKKIAVRAIGSAAVLITVAVGANHLSNSPETEGAQIVRIEPGDKLDNLINEHVEGGANHTGLVRAEVKQDTDNADVYENGQLDPGEELELPERVS